MYRTGLVNEQVDKEEREEVDEKVIKDRK